MSAGTITITAGRAPREGDETDFAGPIGTYPARLIRVGDEVTEPSTMGKAATWSYRIWTFAIDDGSEWDGQIMEVRASTKSSPQSKQFEIISALVGRVPPVGAQIDIKAHLVNRSCLISIKTNDSDYPYIAALMAAPAARAAAPAPAPPGAKLEAAAEAEPAPLPF